MENLQLVLFVLGAVAIIAVLVHGFWSIRRQQPKSLKESPMTGLYTDKTRDSDGFDADGVGPVRVVKNNAEQGIPKATSSSRATPAGVRAQEREAEEASQSFSLSDEPKQKAPRSRQEPVLSATPGEEVADAQLEQMELGLGQAPAQPSLFEDPVTERKQEPVRPAPQVDAAQPAQATQAQPTQAQPVEPQQVESKPEPQVAEEAPLGEPQDVLVLHVVAKEGEALNGAELLPSLLTLNFKFGEMDIFHRHEDNAGTGKVLFSLANMVKPGVFNPDEMEQFTTQGIVLFMTLPCYGDPLMNFSIMLNSAHQLADDLGGEVLDGGRGAWSEQTKQSYLQRIRAQM
ncbi:cell division protein ZipA [Shewanella sp. Isolate8]|uniref:cell division protein ZipA n=1 Tax=Shewanella sp. Isolate8 TaxID=2908529 RepID=UPI001EFECBAF|nr:cell division protein ZipA [Shewanella sp. Isolate8]MCG9746891.1 cell division protein ZipA [Shewanella sp. Isolate8]